MAEEESRSQNREDTNKKVMFGRRFLLTSGLRYWRLEAETESAALQLGAAR